MYVAAGSGPVYRAALVYDAGRAFDAKVVAGVVSYFQRDNRYIAFLGGRLGVSGAGPGLPPDEYDGIIANVEDPEVASAVTTFGVPVVGFGRASTPPRGVRGAPYFHTDNQAISREGAYHLHMRGFRSLAFCGYPANAGAGWSVDREKAFTEEASKLGLPVLVLRLPPSDITTWGSIRSTLCEWLRCLPRPVGIMAADDGRGRDVLDACRSCHLRIPEDVAVVGVDNDELRCNLTSPPLSSVDPSADKLGFSVAAMLDLLIRGAHPTPLQPGREPARVVERRSTDILALDDPALILAMQFIRERSCEPIDVRQVASGAGVSRTTLESRFRLRLGRTVRDTILRAHVQRARQLMRDTALPLKQIASDSGFRSVQHMTTCFGRIVGVPPGKYRRLGVRQ